MTRIHLVPREQLLYEHGDAMGWRRRYRGAVHHCTRHYVSCLHHLGAQKPGYVQLKRQMRACSLDWFGVATWTEYRLQQEQRRQHIMALPGTSFAGQTDVVRLCNNEP